MLLGLWFFKKVFLGYWEESFFLFVLIGPGKPIFSGSVLLFYFKSFYTSLRQTYVLKHVTWPFVYYLLILIFRFFLRHGDPDFGLYLSFFFSFCALLIFWYYFIITRKELKTVLKRHLIPRAFKKVNVLFYSVYFFLLQIPLWDMLRNLLQTGILPDGIHASFAGIYHLVFKIFGEYLAYGYLHILGYLLFLYALSELSFFKRIFLPRNPSLHENARTKKLALDKEVDSYFNLDKKHTDPKLTAERCAKDLNISKKELMDYLKVSGKGKFKNFVNHLRILEFKTLLLDKNNSRFDIISLAKQAGFQSKSTFFRVFRESEGMTPNAYKKRLGHLHMDSIHSAGADAN